MEKKCILKVEELKRSYIVDTSDAKQMEFPVLKGISFSVNEHEFVGIMGRSGCGKTTLLKTLGFIDEPNSGNVWFKETSADEIFGERLARIRREELGFVFQDYYLMESITVMENIMLPLILNEEDIKRSKEQVIELAEEFQIQHLLNKKPFELSGGEKQRVAICRALVADPTIIFADEPTGNLDSQSTRIVIEAFEKINEELKKTIVLVTHDAEVASHCSRIIFLKDGVILEDLKRQGTVEEFYQEIVDRMKEL